MAVFVSFLDVRGAGLGAPMGETDRRSTLPALPQPAVLPQYRPWLVVCCPEGVLAKIESELSGGAIWAAGVVLESRGAPVVGYV